MEISYWQSRWQNNNIGWHSGRVYPPLPATWPLLSLTFNPKVLVPLCGKSLDMSWLAKQGCYVIGVEVSQKALQEFMNHHPEEFQRESNYGFPIYKSKKIELWEGDFFKLPYVELPDLDLIYDKASIVAFPPKMRKHYGQKILDLCGNSTQILLQTFEYDQKEMNGPPFSVKKEEIENHFGQQFQISLLREQSKLNELSKFQRRGLKSYLTEKIYHLKPLHKH
jgi:thiopurine S-methyltransferase